VPNRIYLDHAATSPLRPEARAAMEEGVRHWANPSSPHAEGRKARALLEEARERCKAALGWEGELIFTSGASESAAIALTRARGGARLVSAVEHDAVLGVLPDAEVLPVLPDGALDRDLLREAVDGREVPVVAIQSLNSETGNGQEIPALAEIVHAAGGLLVVDAAQSAGKLALPAGADMVVVSAHKFGGPIGIGALLVRDFALLAPSSGHERGYRRGTENLLGALGMAAALQACTDPYVATGILAPLDTFADDVRALGGAWLSDRLSGPTPFIRALAMPGMSGSAQLMRFDMAGIAVSQGSACSSGTMRRSHVLEAMGMDAELADQMIRVSFGWNTTRAEVERFCEVWRDMARKA